jgi:uncharacterized protein (DUF1778 family)
VSTTLKRSRPENHASTRINLRIDAKVKGVLVRAAKLRQVKLTEFMVKAAQSEAEIALANQTRFVLSGEKWRAFNAALDAPPQEIPALRKLFREPSVFKDA